MKGFWETTISILISFSFGAILAAINDGTKMDGMFLGMFYLIWLELRSK